MLFISTLLKERNFYNIISFGKHNCAVEKMVLKFKCYKDYKTLLADLKRNVVNVERFKA